MGQFDTTAYIFKKHTFCELYWQLKLNFPWNIIQTLVPAIKVPEVLPEAASPRENATLASLNVDMGRQPGCLCLILIQSTSQHLDSTLSCQVCLKFTFFIGVSITLATSLASMVIETHNPCILQFLFFIYLKLFIHICELQRCLNVDFG